MDNYLVKKIRNYIALIGLLIIIVVPVVKLFQLNKTLKEQDKKIIQLRKELLLSDSLYTIRDGMYKKSVIDLYTSKELNEELRKSNEELSEEVQKLRGKVVVLQEINLQLVNKVDTVYVSEDLVDKDSVVAFYPSITAPLIKFNRNYQPSLYTDSWEFSTFKLDIAIFQEQSGEFTAILNTPEWIKLNKLEVKTVELNPPKVDNFDWVTMVGVHRNLGTGRLDMGIDLGMRYKRNIITVGTSTGNTMGIRYGRLW